MWINQLRLLCLHKRLNRRRCALIYCLGMRMFLSLCPALHPPHNSVTLLTGGIPWLRSLQLSISGGLSFRPYIVVSLGLDTGRSSHKRGPIKLSTPNLKAILKLTISESSNIIPGPVLFFKSHYNLSLIHI